MIKAYRYDHSYYIHNLQHQYLIIWIHVWEYFYNKIYKLHIDEYYTLIWYKFRYFFNIGRYIRRYMDILGLQTRNNAHIASPVLLYQLIITYSYSFLIYHSIPYLELQNVYSFRMITLSFLFRRLTYASHSKLRMI